MTEIVTSGSMRGERKRSYGPTYAGTKLETADTDKVRPTAAASLLYSTPWKRGLKLKL